MIPAFVIRNNGGDYNTQSNNSYKFSDLIPNFQLTADDPYVVTIPIVSTAIYSGGGSSNRLLAFFSFTEGVDVFLQPDNLTTIAYPTGTQVNSNIELNPHHFGGREVFPGQELQLLTPGTDVFGTIRLYAISNQI